VETLNSAPLRLGADGKHFLTYGNDRALHLYTWDGLQKKIFDNADQFALSRDGTRILTYKEQFVSDSHMGTNRYVLDARVRDVDGTYDVSGHYEEDRGGDFTNDSAVSGVTFAPDGTHIVFVRSQYVGQSLDVFLTRFDVATGAITQGMDLGAASNVFVD